MVRDANGREILPGDLVADKFGLMVVARTSDYGPAKYNFKPRGQFVQGWYARWPGDWHVIPGAAERSDPAMMMAIGRAKSEYGTRKCKAAEEARVRRRLDHPTADDMNPMLGAIWNTEDGVREFEVIETFDEEAFYRPRVVMIVEDGVDADPWAQWAKVDGSGAAAEVVR